MHQTMHSLNMSSLSSFASLIVCLQLQYATAKEAETLTVVAVFWYSTIEPIHILLEPNEHEHVLTLLQVPTIIWKGPERNDI